MSKSRDAFRTISEVSDALDTPAHVLRFWESKFKQVKPVKRAGGRRYYRPGDVDLLAGIKKLLHDDGMTIKGAQKLMREQGVKHVAGLGADTLPAPSKTIDEARPSVEPVDSLAADEAKTITASEPETQVEPAEIVASETPEPTPETPPQPGPALTLDLAPAADSEPQSVDIDAPETDDAAATDTWRNVATDPADSDSKAEARLFHLLQRTNSDALAKQAQAIAPLLARMQTLRARISSR